MIDEIFEMIMKEARVRPGKDFTAKVRDVLLELDIKVFEAIENITETLRRKKIDENKRADT